MDEVGDWQQRAASFDETATAYELGRPEYPDAALDWWDECGAFEPGYAVLDLAAGTGKLTRMLPSHACELAAVEPLANMRAELAKAVPWVSVHDGSAEAIPFPDDSFDTVLVAQAFHWFDKPRALDEITRVLRPGGGLGLIWNTDDESKADWIAAVVAEKRSVAASPVDDDDAVTAALAENGNFAPAQSIEIEWTDSTTVDGVLANVLSRSYVSSLEPAERRAVLTRVRESLEPLGDVIEFPYSTIVFWAPLASAAGE